MIPKSRQGESFFQIIKRNFHLNLFREEDDKASNFHLYFYPELSPFLSETKKQSIEEKLKKIDPDILENFKEKREKGQNDSYICTLIQNDSIDEFISHVTRTNTPLRSTITHSLFDTNSFLIKQEKSSLIEYAVFYGSIQIFNYLRLNDIELTPSLWLYTIHGRNPEIIHLLEEFHVVPSDSSYDQCLEESIKCHHNEIANYIQDNLLDKEEEEKRIQENFDKNIYRYGFHYYNYTYFPNDLKYQYFLHYLCCYDYLYLVKLYIKMPNININATVVFNIYFFFNWICI